MFDQSNFFSPQIPLSAEAQTGTPIQRLADKISTNPRPNLWMTMDVDSLRTTTVRHPTKTGDNRGGLELDRAVGSFPFEGSPNPERHRSSPLAED